MTEIYHQRGQEMQHGYQHHNQHEQHWGQSTAHQIAKAATAVTAGGSLLVLSGLTLAGTVIALTVATPILVIFSPVLVPAVITVFVLATGFLTSGGLGIAAATVLAWMYRYVTGQHPTGADSLDEATHKLGSKAREFRDRSEHAMGGGGGGGGGGGHYGTHHTTGTGIGHH